MGKKVSKKVKVVKKYVEEGLEAKGLTQADLAQMIDRDYKYVNNCLNAGEISERILEKIGAVIDRMPAYLMGEPMIFPDEVYGYSLHEQQDSFLINKMKKDLEKLKESKVIVVQNGALLLDGEIDDLISLMPSRVQTK